MAHVELNFKFQVELWEDMLTNATEHWKATHFILPHYDSLTICSLYIFAQDTVFLVQQGWELFKNVSGIIHPLLALYLLATHSLFAHY